MSQMPKEDIIKKIAELKKRREELDNELGYIEADLGDLRCELEEKYGKGTKNHP